MTSGNNVLRSLIHHSVLSFLFSLSLIFISLSAFTADEADGIKEINEINLEELMQGFAQIKQAHAKFTEKKYLRILNQPLELSGTLSYKAPGYLEKHTLLPKPERIVLERDQITIENKAKNLHRTFGLQDYPLIGALVESIRSTLAGDVNTLKKFYSIKLDGNGHNWLLSLQPLHQNVKTVINEIRISGTENKITHIEMIEAEGDRSVMTVIHENH